MRNELWSGILLKNPTSFSNVVKIPRPVKNLKVYIVFTKDTGHYSEVKGFLLCKKLTVIFCRYNVDCLCSMSFFTPRKAFRVGLIPPAIIFLSHVKMKNKKIEYVTKITIQVLLK
jgi:hypothetical protein